MSTEGTVDALEIMGSGFTITKKISRRDGEHLQVDLEITSTHDKKASIDLAEPLPPGTDETQIGFLPDNEPDEWRVTDPNMLLMQARLVPEGTRQIVYGVQQVQGEEIDATTGEPQITAVGGPAGEEIEAEAVEVTNRGDDHAAEPETDTQSPEAAGDGTEGKAADGAGVTGAGGALETPLDDETAAALAAELAPHLEDEVSTDPVTETKLDQLQDDVADVRTYLPAFEDFLGDAGRADDIIDTLDDLKAEVDAMNDVPDEFEETLERVDNRMASLEDTSEQLSDQLEVVQDRLEELEGWREDIATASQ